MTSADHANTASNALDTLGRIVHEHHEGTTGGWYAIVTLRAALDALEAQAEANHIPQEWSKAYREMQVRAEAAEAERDRLREALDAIESELGTLPLDHLGPATERAVSKAWAMAREKRPDPELIPAPISRAALATDRTEAQPWGPDHPSYDEMGQ